MRTLLLAVGVAIGFAVPAKAETFTESVQFGLGRTDFKGSTGTTAGPGGDQLYYFDSNGGTLTSITFQYSYAIASQITVTAPIAATGTVITRSGAQFGSSSPSVTAALNRAVNNYVDPTGGTSVSFGATALSPIAADVRGNASSYTLTAGGSQTFNSGGSYSSVAYTDTNAADLAAFSQAGGGTFTPLFTTLTGLNNTVSGGNTMGMQMTNAQGNLAITFDYTPAAVTTSTAVPEPASLALLGLSLGAAGVAAVRRRQAS